AKVNDDLLTLLKTKHQEALIKESEGVEEVSIVRLGGGPDDADLLHAFRFLDQRFLVLRLEQGEEVVVDLRVALQPLQAELDGRHLTVLLEELAHLTVEDLLATAQQGNLGVDLAPHLAAHLP